MEKPLYPSTNMRITQGYQEGTHKDSFAIDDAGIDSGISTLKAPFTGIIKKIYSNDANEVWLESIEQVEYPDGTIDYMTIMFAHSNDISDLFIGKTINKGEEFYSEGTKGNVTGNHCHIECGQGKFDGAGWHKNNSGYYSINNGKKPEECLWIDKTINIINNNNYNFKMIQEESKDINQQEKSEVIPENKETIPEDKKDENINIDNNTNENANTNTSIDNSSDINTNTDINSNHNTNATPKLIFTCKKTDLYGIYLKENEKVYIE